MTINTLHNGSYAYTLQQDGTGGVDFIYTASGLRSDMPHEFLNPHWHSSVEFAPASSGGSPYPSVFHYVNAPLVFGEETHSKNNQSGTVQLPTSYIGQHGTNQFSYIWSKGIGLIAGNNIPLTNGGSASGLVGEIWLGGANNAFIWRPSGMANFTLTAGHTYRIDAVVRFRSGDGWLEVLGDLYEDNVKKQSLSGLAMSPAEYNGLSSSSYVRSVIGRTQNTGYNYDTDNYDASLGTVWA